MSKSSYLLCTQHIICRTSSQNQMPNINLHGHLCKWFKISQVPFSLCWWPPWTSAVSFNAHQSKTKVPLQERQRLWNSLEKQIRMFWETLRHHLQTMMKAECIIWYSYPIHWNDCGLKKMHKMHLNKDKFVTKKKKKEKTFSSLCFFLLKMKITNFLHQR